MAAKLSMVATPIGNLEDITLRALRVLKEADIIACEDTRVTKKLLSHFDIHTPTVSFHANSGAKGFEKILKLLDEDKQVAVVSDAGTPGVSDPGLELVSVVREKMPEVYVEAIAGPSALAAALSVAGLRAPSFIFYGFLPQKKGRDTLFKEIAASERASVFYESPHRIIKALEALVEFLDADRRIASFANLLNSTKSMLSAPPLKCLRILRSMETKCAANLSLLSKESKEVYYFICLKKWAS